MFHVVVCIFCFYLIVCCFSVIWALLPEINVMMMMIMTFLKLSYIDHSTFFVVLLHLLLYYCTAPLNPCKGRPISYRDDDDDDDVIMSMVSCDCWLLSQTHRLCDVLPDAFSTSNLVKKRPLHWK